jgi:V8-like Glu-specific endopeptidase
MGHRFFIFLFCLFLCAIRGAQAEPVLLSHEEGRAFHYVGRLNIAGTRFCTATLITEQFVVTAAHCLYNPRTRQRVPDRMMHFVAGLNRGALVAARRVKASHILPDYRYDGTVSLSRLGSDVALLVLEHPIDRDDVNPVSVAPAADLPSGPLALVSYSRGRPYAPSIETGARLLGRRGRVAMMDFAVTFGASGAPLLTEEGGEKRLFGIVSATSRHHGRPVALTIPVTDALHRLMALVGH